MSATGHNARRRMTAADKALRMPAATLERYGLPRDRDALMARSDIMQLVQRMEQESAPEPTPEPAPEAAPYTRSALEAMKAGEVKALAQQATGEFYTRKQDAVEALLGE